MCSENKGADQLRSYRKADLCLCFRICKNLVFSWRGSFTNHILLLYDQVCVGPVPKPSSFYNFVQSNYMKRMQKVIYRRLLSL